jgi:very-short-patch-repair endonuclease
LKALSFLAFCIALAAMLGALLVALKKRGALSAPDSPWPFYAKRPLSTPEQVLYYRLVRCLPEHIVLAQVQVSRVLGVKKGFNFHEWNNWISRLSYDFVVCTKDARVLAAIELDDSTHESPKRSGTDAKKDKATAAAGIRLLRWHVKSLPDETAVRQAVAE